MIAYRARRCPLRRPRIWAWALVVALPAHIAVGWALSMRGQNLVACPVTNPLRVTLHHAVPTLATAPATRVATRPAPSNKHIASKPQPRRPMAAKAKPVPQTVSAEAIEPAAGSAALSPMQPAAQPGIMGVANLGFVNPPRPPAYPAASRARGEEGTALLLAFIKYAGTPAELKLERSSGFNRLDQAAMQAAAQWEFNAPAAPTWVRVPVRFALTEAR